METEKILFFRNLLLRCFLVGLGFAILFGLITLMAWDSLMPWAAGKIDTNPEELRELTLQFFLNVRIVLVFFMLVPAIALHWMAKGKGGIG